MIRIRFEQPDEEDWTQWREKCIEEQANLNTAVEQNEPLDIKGSIYRGERYGIKAKYFISPDGPFFGKCVFCEEHIYRSQHGDIEHYRPKKAVTDENDVPVTIDVDGTARPHPGYYWLAYEWRNLLPACQLCNQRSTDKTDSARLGKRNRFPVAGFRATGPGEEEDESPLLINPTIDDPEQHIGVDQSGVLFAKSDIGRMTIRVLGLNHRDLPDTRKDVIRKTQCQLRLFGEGFRTAPNGDEANALRELVAKIQRGSSEFAAAARVALAEFRSSTKALLEVTAGESAEVD